MSELCRIYRSLQLTLSKSKQEVIDVPEFAAKADTVDHEHALEHAMMVRELACLEKAISESGATEVVSALIGLRSSAMSLASTYNDLSSDIQKVIVALPQISEE